MSEFYIDNCCLAAVTKIICGSPVKTSRNTSMRGTRKETKMLQQLTVDNNDAKGDELEEVQ